MLARWSRAVALAVVPVAIAAADPIEVLRSWDFTRGLEGWDPNFDVASVRTTTSGLEFESTGIDPWITSPSVDCPAGKGLRFTVRLRSQANSSGQLFYGRSFSEEDSVRFTVAADGTWREYVVLVPEQGSGTRFRLDPATAPGAIAVAWARLEAIAPVSAPPLSPPRRPVQGALSPVSIASGPLELVHYRGRFGGFVLRVDGIEVASSHDAERLAYFEADDVAWLELSSLAVTVTKTNGSLVEVSRFTDGGGGRWTLRREFAPGLVEGTIDVDAEVSCDRARQAVHVSWLTLFPGLGTYGEEKGQALLPGLEYLEDEPSSSQADLTTADHVRRVPHPAKITFPLLALERDGRWLALAWSPSDLAAAVFDTPDRVFASGAHLLALWAPNVGSLRAENSLWAQLPFAVEPTKPLRVRASILGGAGASVVPALQQYVAVRDLPAVPAYAGGFSGAVRLLSAGWLDSDCYEGGGRWRHAVWSGFGAQAASDAIAFLLWLANHSPDPPLAERLRAEAAVALDARRSDDPLFLSGVSHVQWPITSLLFGNVEGQLASRKASAQGQTGKFDAEGICHYPQSGDDPKYGTTHYTDHANGYSARRLQSVLEAAALTGSASLTSSALSILDRQTALYAGSVPRGAQTWEIPLHTPDILASAWLLKSYVIAYELTGQQEYLEQARYWAWTGVPFVYLQPWTTGKVGTYATIPVLGATNWVAPVWLGKPVQWCGLVYGAWVGRLAVHDPDGPWDRIAMGITATGIEMSWPTSDAARQGLLPDFFSLERQQRDGPAINPGTVQATFPELYGRGSLYGFRRARTLGWLLHAPAAIRSFVETATSISFSADGWGPDPYRILVSRVSARPARVLSRPEGSADFRQAPFTFDGTNRWLIVEATGNTDFRILARDDVLFLRGDSNSSGEVDLSDAIQVLSFLFLGEAPAGCSAAADANRDGAVNVSDPQFLLNFLFLGGTAIPAPFPACGIDPLGSAASCGSFDACAP